MQKYKKTFNKPVALFLYSFTYIYYKVCIVLYTRA